MWRQGQGKGTEEKEKAREVGPGAPLFFGCEIRGCRDKAGVHVSVLGE